MKKILLTLLFLAGCGRGDEPANEQSAPESRAAPGSKAPAADRAGDARLTGLYEGGAGPRKNQLCIVEKGRDAQFGLLVWGGDLHSCSGAGQAIRAGERLTLKMTGDETCAIEATLKGGTVTLPGILPTGCAYYCAARASFAGARFTRSGASAADAKRATDIAGDPLCD